MEKLRTNIMIISVCIAFVAMANLTYKFLHDFLFLSQGAAATIGTLIYAPFLIIVFSKNYK